MSVPAERTEVEREQNAKAKEARALGGQNRAARTWRSQRIVVREYGERVAPEADARRGPGAGAKRRQAMTAVVGGKSRLWRVRA